MTKDKNDAIEDVGAYVRNSSPDITDIVNRLINSHIPYVGMDKYPATRNDNIMLRVEEASKNLAEISIAAMIHIRDIKSYTEGYPEDISVFSKALPINIRKIQDDFREEDPNNEHMGVYESFFEAQYETLRMVLSVSCKGFRSKESIESISSTVSAYTEVIASSVIAKSLGELGSGDNCKELLKGIKSSSYIESEIPKILIGTKMINEAIF